ncbi:MAG: hypothetical protein ACREQN_17335 [Candidatus Binataceae bacterium]
MADSNEATVFPWRAAILSALTVILFALALWFYNNHRPELGLLLLGCAFVVPMVWVILAARESESAGTPLHSFIPRIAGWLVLGTVFLGIFWWNVNRHISMMEAGFAAIYILCAFVAMRILNGKRDSNRTNLRSIEGRRPRPGPRQRPGSR